MSQSPRLAENTDPVDHYDDAWNRTGQMIREGASLSGRERNCLFLNVAGKTFVDVSGAAQVDFPEDGRALASTDWDGDGDLDLILHNRNSPRLRILRNDWPERGHFLRLRLVGTQSNADAIGARVELWPAGDTRPLVRSVRAGEAFLSQSSRWVHFTWRDAEEVARLVVRWPSGRVDEFHAVAGDRIYLLREGEAELTPWTAPSPGPTTAAVARNDDATSQPPAPPNPVDDPDRGAASPASSQAPAASAGARVALLGRLPLPRLTWLDAHGNEGPLAPVPGRPLLLVLWATWCQPCLAELRMLAELAPELAAANVDVRLLSIEELEARSGGALPPRAELQATSQRVAAVLARLGVDFAAGLATATTLDRLDVLARVVIDQIRPWPLPASLLVDGQGQVAVLYRGPLEREQLRSDLAHLTGDPETIRAWAGPFPGQWYFRRSLYPDLPGLRTEYRTRGWHDEAREVTQIEIGWLRRHGNEADQALADGLARDLAAEFRRLADDAFAAGNLAGAETHYTQAVAAWPADTEALNNLGVLFERQSRWSEAERSLRAALAVDPASLSAASNLGSVLAGQGQVAAALDVYRQALAVRPEAPVLENNLAWTLATAADPAIRQASEALTIARRLCERTDYQNPSYLDTLAAAQAAEGDFAQASSTAELAWQRAAASGAEELAAAIRARRALYLRQEAYVSPQP